MARKSVARAASRREWVLCEGKMTTMRETITMLLSEALAPTRLDVIDESHLHAGHGGSRPGGETHFRVRVAAAAFDGQSRLDRHRTVNRLLAGPLRDGVHALAIEARGAREDAAA